MWLSIADDIRNTLDRAQGYPFQVAERDAVGGVDAWNVWIKARSGPAAREGGAPATYVVLVLGGVQVDCFGPNVLEAGLGVGGG